VRIGYHRRTTSMWDFNMKTKNEITIDADRQAVWRVFDNAGNISKWQPTLKSFTHKSGPSGQPGSVAELVYEENGREIVMTETMTEKRKPDFMAGIYDSNLGKAIIVNHFATLDENKTQWVVYANRQFKGMMKLMSIFMRKSICRRTEEDMQRFKLLVESVTAEEA